MKTHISMWLLVGRRLAWPVDPGAFRLFLAMLVFVHHFSSLDWGKYAVYVFFVLSGFWVETMWNERYRHTRQPYLTYMVSRVWRLAPSMVLVSGMTLLLLPLIGIPLAQIYSSNPLHLAFSTVFLLGYAWLPYMPVGSAWSLDIEMQFYLLAPLLALVLGLGKGAGRALLLLAGACSVVSAFAIDAYVLPRYIGFFVVGMLAARAAWRPSQKLAHSSAGVVVALVLGVTISPWRSILIGGAHAGPLHIYAPAFNIVLGVLSVPFAVYTTGRPSDAIDRMMADLSYIVYLLHWVGMQWFFQIKPPFVRRLVVAAVCFATIPPVSYLIWRYYDKPLNRIRARWVSSRLREAEGAVALRADIARGAIPAPASPPVIPAD